MPSIAHITVKADNGTTDVVYTAQQPSSGDGVNAVFQVLTVGNAPVHRPEFRIHAKDSNKGLNRSLRSTYVYPQLATDTTTNLTTVVGKALITSDWVIPKGMNQLSINECVSQYANLLASALIRTSCKDGFAPS